MHSTSSFSKYPKLTNSPYERPEPAKSKHANEILCFNISSANFIDSNLEPLKQCKKIIQDELLN